MNNIKGYFEYIKENLDDYINRIFKQTLDVERDFYYVKNKEKAASEIAELLGDKNLANDILIILKNELSTPKGFYYIEGKDRAIEEIKKLKSGYKPRGNGSFLAAEPGNNILPPDPPEVVAAIRRRNEEIHKQQNNLFGRIDRERDKGRVRR